MSRLEDSGVGGVHRRQLVNVETDPVASAVTEVIAMTSIPNDRAAGFIDLPSLDARPYRSNTSRLNDDLSDIHSIMKKNINEVRFYFCCLPTHACEVCRVCVLRVAVRARAAAVDACLVVCVSVPVSSSCLDLSVFERY